MYIGNGVTKKFPIPDGYDGSVVILKMPGGKGIRMTQDEGYTVKEGAVYFFAPVPAGIEISFDEMDESELMKRNSKSYVIIYADGSMREVDEDPTLILEETRKLLIDAKRCAVEITQAYSDAKKYIDSMISSSGADLDGRLDGYSASTEQAVIQAANEVRERLSAEWTSTLERLSVETQTVKDILKSIERIKNETIAISNSIADNLKSELLAKCDDVLQGCNDLKILKSEVQTIAADVKLAITKTAQDASEEMRLKINEELELLRNLRSKMQEDFNTLNTKINNRWELLEAKLNG